MAKRITFEFKQRSYDRLTKLKSTTESSTYSDVVKQSLKLYEWVIEQAEQGNDLYMKGSDGQSTIIPLFLEH